jgi:predicted  nucleic acid-binding Zn-ribbon protein
MSSQYVARCTRCNKSFTKEDLVGASGCPACGTRNLPMSPDQDVTININVHELRILGIWAENHAVGEDNRHLDDPNWESMKESVNIIAERIEDQLRAIGKHAPLTLSREVKELQKQFGNAELYRDGREEIP